MAKRLRPGVVVAIVSGGLTVGVGLIVASRAFAEAPTKKKKQKRGADFAQKVPRGHVVCPLDEGKIGVNPARIARGDFVILKLASANNAVSENVWGHVLGVRDGIMRVQLTPTLSESGIRLFEEQLGFGVGEIIDVSASCAYDVLDRSLQRPYEIICGVFLADLGYSGLPEKVLRLKTGDLVTVVVGNPPATPSSLPGKTWNEKLRVSVISTGPTGDIVRGMVWEDPEMTETHGLSKYSKLEFTRDCVAEA